MPASNGARSPKTAACSRTIFSTMGTNSSSCASVPRWCTASRIRAGVPPPGRATVNSRTACALNSIGESMKYWKIGRREGQRVVGREQLCGDTPRAARRLREADADRRVRQRRRPGEGRRYVQVCMRAIDGRVGAVDAIGKQPVAHVHDVARRHDAPLGGRQQFGGERRVAVTACLEEVDVLAELVRRVASWRRSRHPHFERRARPRPGSARPPAATAALARESRRCTRWFARSPARRRRAGGRGRGRRERRGDTRTCRLE